MTRPRPAAADDAAARLAELRARIDAVDDAILALLRARAAVVCQVGAIKEELSLPTVYDGAREDQVLRRLVARGTSPLQPSAVVSIFSAVIAASRSLQHGTSQEPARSAAPAPAAAPEASAPRHRATADAAAQTVLAVSVAPDVLRAALCVLCDRVVHVSRVADQASGSADPAVLVVALRGDAADAQIAEIVEALRALGARVEVLGF